MYGGHRLGTVSILCEEEKLNWGRVHSIIYIWTLGKFDKIIYFHPLSLNGADIDTDRGKNEYE